MIVAIVAVVAQIVLKLEVEVLRDMYLFFFSPPKYFMLVSCQDPPLGLGMRLGYIE